VLVGAGDFVLADPVAGLEALSTYAASVQIGFDGTANGSPSNWTASVGVRAASDGSVKVRTVELHDAPEDLLLDPATWRATVGASAYRLDEDGACVSESHEASAALLDDPASLLTPIIGATPNGSAVVNGIEANSFTFDRHALGILADVQVDGRLSVAIEGGYIAQYKLAITGGPDYFGDGVNGTLTTTYDVTDVGAPVEPELPADCATELIELSLPTDATSVTNEPGFLAYYTQEGMNRAVEFVRVVALLAHWTQIGEAAIDTTFGALEFEAEGMHYQALFSKEDAGTYVQVIASRK
jgi:hypothetical protein